MNFIYLAFILCYSTTQIQAGIINQAAIEQYDEHPPQYEFHYSVHDSITGDIKDQFEHRRGDYVTGRYSLIEPDGQRRIVDYSSDPLLGFTAQVRRELPLVEQQKTETIEEWPLTLKHRR